METLKIHAQGVNAYGKAYPMFQTQKFTTELVPDGYPPRGYGEMTLVHDGKLNVGEALTFTPHYICMSTQPPLPLVVSEILEERKPKGNHKKGCIFYSIKFKFGY